MNAIGFLRAVCLWGVWLSLNAQQVSVSEADIWTEVSDKLPLSVAKDQAKDAAIREATEKAFGTAIYQSSSLSLQTNNGKTNSDFQVRSDSYVRGVWIETLSLKQEVSLRKQHNAESWWLRTVIRGRVRERTSTPAKLEFLISNCPSVTCVTTNFFSGERIFALAETDKDGYLTVFMDDRITTYQLLPYQTMPKNQPYFSLRAHQPYVLFSNKPEHHYFPQNPYFQEDELVAAADKPEYYRLYALWTPTEVGLPKTKSAGYSEPGKMTTAEFQQWLSKVLSQEEQTVLKVVDVAFLPASKSN